MWLYLLGEKWMNNVVDIIMVSDKIIVMKVLKHISVTTVYNPEYSLDDSQKNNFYGTPSVLLGS